MKKMILCCVWMLVMGAFAKSVISFGEPIDKQPAQPTPQKLVLTPDQAVDRGLQWLISRQQPNGGWGKGHQEQGEKTDVGNTCIALQALWRSGVRPQNQKWGAVLARGLDYVLKEIESADDASLFVTRARGTQLQGKLGTYVDTFLAAATLAEMKDALGEVVLERRLNQALIKVTTKIENHQLEDGTWANRGWAPALAQGLATKGLNRAARKGVKVNREKIKKAGAYGEAQFQPESQSFDAAGSAGVELYAVASSVTAMEEVVATQTNDLRELEQRLEDADELEKKDLRQEIQNIKKYEASHRAAQQALIKRLDDDAFVAGFGSNGGEEFLSYLQISESLRAKGGSEWISWNHSMKENLTRIQDEDGCWRGKHCITGGTFCTATAILVMTEEKAGSPIASTLKPKK